MDRGGRRAASGRRAVAVLLALPWLSPGAAAQTASGPALAAPCAACHGPGGVSPGEIPSIAGMNAQAMAGRMREFRNAGAEATIMNRIARGYTDAEIDALSQYVSTLKR